MSSEPLVECVPNFSEGRRPDVVEALAAACALPGITLLDREMDADHNRCVITFVGPAVEAAEAAFRAAAEAVRRIDLTAHKGAHPRMGAVDVIPFVPIGGIDLSGCVALARSVGERIGRELEVPVFLYEAAATRPGRRNLADVRRGQFEGLRDAIGKDPARDPDFGPRRIHPTAGAVAVGARMPLIAYNVNLRSTDLPAAQRIASAVREANGGLPGVKALGLSIPTRGIVQVSMNLCDHTRTGIAAAFAAVRDLAAEAGIEVLDSEIVGLAPRAAMAGLDPRSVLLAGFSDDQIVEHRIERMRNPS